MHDDGSLYAGTSIRASIDLQTVIYDGFLDVGFTRGYASSQAYADKYGNNTNLIPTNAATGLSFPKVAGDVYEWLGFEAYQLLFAFSTRLWATRHSPSIFSPMISTSPTSFHASKS
jgi:hypothetical protein